MQGMAWNKVRQNHCFLIAMFLYSCTCTLKRVNSEHWFVAVPIPWKAPDAEASLYSPLWAQAVCVAKEDKRALGKTKAWLIHLWRNFWQLLQNCYFIDHVHFKWTAWHFTKWQFPEDLLFTMDRNLLFCLSPQWYLFMESGWSFSISMSKFSVVNLVLCV